jgi:HD-like signal output (HDOD) protein
LIAIHRHLDRIESLPPAPTVAIQLLELFSDSDRDIDRIVELIKHDPSLTAATLKRCNSGAVSGAEPATDMFEAVSLLGLYEI